MLFWGSWVDVMLVISERFPKSQTVSRQHTTHNTKTQNHKDHKDHKDDKNTQKTFKTQTQQPQEPKKHKKPQKITTPQQNITTTQIKTKQQQQQQQQQQHKTTQNNTNQHKTTQINNNTRLDQVCPFLVSPSFVPLAVDIMDVDSAAVRGGTGSARRRRECRLRQNWRHEQLTLRTLLATYQHHAAPRGQTTARSELNYTATIRRTPTP